MENFSFQTGFILQSIYHLWKSNKIDEQQRASLKDMVVQKSEQMDQILKKFEFHTNYDFLYSDLLSLVINQDSDKFNDKNPYDHDSIGQKEIQPVDILKPSIIQRRKLNTNVLKLDLKNSNIKRAYRLASEQAEHFQSFGQSCETSVKNSSLVTTQQNSPTSQKSYNPILNENNSQMKNLINHQIELKETFQRQVLKKNSENYGGTREKENNFVTIKKETQIPQSPDTASPIDALIMEKKKISYTNLRI